MRNFYDFMLFSVALCFSLISCSKGNVEEDVTSADFMLDLPEEFLQVGVKHNEGVDYAYQGIKDYFSGTKTQTLQDISKDELLEIALSTLEDYCGNPPFFTKAAEASGDTPTLDSEIEIYFERLKSFFNENPEITSAELIDELNVINVMASAQLSDTLKKAAVFSGTATCYSSYNYWKENHKKWIVYADGRGAAIGAMTGAAVGGIGAGPGAVSLGAGASISEVIDQWKK